MFFDDVLYNGGCEEYTICRFKKLNFKEVVLVWLGFRNKIDSFQIGGES